MTESVSERNRAGRRIPLNTVYRRQDVPAETSERRGAEDREQFLERHAERVGCSLEVARAMVRRLAISAQTPPSELIMRLG
jgi:hypothetical protein